MIEKRSRGAPSKYGEDTTTILLRGPISVINEIRVRAEISGFSTTEYIIGCLIHSDKILVQDTLKKINDLQTGYRTLSSMYNTQNEEIQKLTGLMKPTSFLIKIERDEILNSFLEKNKENILKLKLNEPELVSLLFNQFEEYILELEEPYKISNKENIKILIKRELFKLRKDRNNEQINILIKEGILKQEKDREKAIIEQKKAQEFKEKAEENRRRLWKEHPELRNKLIEAGFDYSKVV